MPDRITLGFDYIGRALRGRFAARGRGSGRAVRADGQGPGRAADADDRGAAGRGGAGLCRSERHRGRHRAGQLHRHPGGGRGGARAGAGAARAGGRGQRDRGRGIRAAPTLPRGPAGARRRDDLGRFSRRQRKRPTGGAGRSKLRPARCRPAPRRLRRRFRLQSPSPGIAAARADQPGLPRPAPLYLRPADAAPPREAAPLILP